MGNKAMGLPKQRPLARPALATREERLERTELRLGCACAVQEKKLGQRLPVLPPFSWCGLPTGGYCDFCTKTIANTVCSASGGTAADIMATCRQCQFTGRHPTSATSSGPHGDVTVHLYHLKHVYTTGSTTEHAHKSNCLCCWGAGADTRKIGFSACLTAQI